jgi:branched-subunit amino acid aminotransferase/4-amino-4-deoxychorismate lyase
MTISISFNGEIVDQSVPLLSGLSSSVLYGKGIFTTVAIYDRAPFVWDKHWRRLEENCGRTGIDSEGISSDGVLDELHKLIDTNSIESGRARITIFDESGTELWPYQSERKNSVLITTAEYRRRPEPLSLTVSSFHINSASPLAGVKSCNYLEKVMAKGEAMCRGFDEAIQVNERGEVASASMANIFWLKDGRLFTPHLITGCLAGTTRAYVLENLECAEVTTTIDELCNADEIFLTSAGLGVAQIGRFDGREYAPSRHSIVKLLPGRD